MHSPRQRGFTLIELIVVIVILGVLAATALPKFIDMRKEARVATLKRLTVEITGAANMAQAKCRLLAACSATANAAAGYAWARVIHPDGGNKFLLRGFPVVGGSGYPSADYGSIDMWMNYAGFTFVHSGTRVDFTLDSAPTPTDCKVTYSNNGDATISVTLTTTGC